MARHGCVALHRAARMGRPDNGFRIDMVCSSGGRADLQPPEHARPGQGRQVPCRGGPSTTVGRRRIEEDGGMSTSSQAPSRLRLTSYAALQLLLVVPSVLVFVLVVLGGVLVVAWIGLGVLLVAVPACRWLADTHRTMAGRVLGTPIPDQYQPRPDGGIVVRVTGWATDPMTWRDLAWLLVSATVGFALALLAVLLLVAVVTGALWWYGVGPIMRAHSEMDRWLLSRGHTEILEERVQVLTETRAEAIDHSATELRRIERDLHDGAQARLVALSMSLGLAESLYETDPDAAQQMVADARSTSRAALGELRSVVRGIHPPVLADRGIGGAIEALALDMAVPVSVEVRFEGRPPAPVESAVYFA